MEVDRWDYFIAHAGANTDAAEELYELLAPHSRVFLDSKTLLPGDDWDQELAKAQRSSFVTIVLISGDTDRAYYQREEIAAAISLSRRPAKHRVVPIYLDGSSPSSESVPYGLRLKHGITISQETTLASAADKLLALQNLRTQDGKSVDGDAASLGSVTLPSNAAGGFILIAGLGLLGTGVFAILPQTPNAPSTAALIVTVTAKLLIVTASFMIPLSRWAEQSLGPSSLERFYQPSPSSTVQSWVNPILTEPLSLSWALRTSLLIFPVMLTAGWIGLQFQVFPKNWRDYGSILGWVAYVGAGLFLGMVSMLKSQFLLSMHGTLRARIRTILSLLAIDLAATCFLLVVSLTTLLWAWWNFVESSVMRNFKSDTIGFLETLVVMLNATFLSSARIYLPIGAAAFAPCLLLVMLLTVLTFGSWFSFLRKVSPRFDPQRYPLTSPLVGAIILASCLVALCGVIVTVLDV